MLPSVRWFAVIKSIKVKRPWEYTASKIDKTAWLMVVLHIPPYQAEGRYKKKQSLQCIYAALVPETINGVKQRKVPI